MVWEALRFELLPTGSMVVGEPCYVFEDHAFTFHMISGEKERLKAPEGGTSFVTGTLQLEVAIHNSLCLYIWGYCPMGGWKRATLPAPGSHRGSLHARCDRPLIAGVSIGIEHMVPPTPWFDPDSGWFCMGEKGRVLDADALEFATDTLAVAVGGRLTSLWVRPANWRDVADRFLKAGR